MISSDHSSPVDSQFLVVGAVRNCAYTLEAEIERLRRALQFASAVSFFLVESDSEDETPQLLSLLRRSIPGFRYASLGHLSDLMPARTERIAYCRNIYLNYIQSDSACEKIEFVLVADFDGVNERLNEQSLLSCFSRSDWDVACANQSGLYYDIYALRHPYWSPSDCLAQQQVLFALGASKFRSFYMAHYSKMLKISPHSDWIQVDSAFGGCALYRRQALLGVSYCGLNASGAQICEHVELHRQIRESGGIIFINPALINSHQASEHTINAYGLGLLLFWIRCHLDDLLPGSDQMIKSTLRAMLKIWIPIRRTLTNQKPLRRL
ncbi:MAG: hypothetical protein FJ077_01000 [Cyanobacteria bacterium K_DeepCast_35m_m2_023]|nr:hypothetical protein [Cyanobacteria bacterium K_DeepCast_35m_m2_023]